MPIETPSHDRRSLIAGVLRARRRRLPKHAGRTGGGDSIRVLKPPTLFLAFTAKVTLGPPVEFGAVDGKRKRLIPITGGTVDGPRLRGAVIAGGGDWQAIAPDGTTDIFARYTLRAEDGTIIGVVNPGIRRGLPDVLKRLAAGEAVDPALYYFRTTPTFDVADGPHGWLRQNIFICAGVRGAKDVQLHFYGVT